MFAGVEAVTIFVEIACVASELWEEAAAETARVIALQEGLRQV